MYLLPQSRTAFTTEVFMEERNDLRQLLLNGLPCRERAHVLEVIGDVTADKLRRKRAVGPTRGGGRRLGSSDAAG